jgi:hypothetical protein
MAGTSLIWLRAAHASPHCEIRKTFYSPHDRLAIVAKEIEM